MRAEFPIPFSEGLFRNADIFYATQRRENPKYILFTCSVYPCYVLKSNTKKKRSQRSQCLCFFFFMKLALIIFNSFRNTKCPFCSFSSNKTPPKIREHNWQHQKDTSVHFRKKKNDKWCPRRNRDAHLSLYNHPSTFDVFRERRLPNRNNVLNVLEVRTKGVPSEQKHLPVFGSHYLRYRGVFMSKRSFL